MVSIVVPIYNVANFIEKGVQHILTQTYEAFEIILVDDGSTDGSSEICDAWSEKCPKIKVFHKKNEGAGSARNVGIDNARGEYIYFFDIDDTVEENLLSICVSCMEKYHLDMIQFGYSSYDVVYKTMTNISFNEKLIENNLAFKDVYFDYCVKTVNGFPWNKMYRKSFLDKNKLRFENQRIQQDEVFNLKCYRYIERCLFLNEILYHYVVYNHGNTRSYFISDRFDIYKSIHNHLISLMEFWKIEDSRFYDSLYRRLFYGLNQTLRYNLFHKNCPWSWNRKKDELSRVLNDVEIRKTLAYMSHRKMSMEDRLFFLTCQLQSLFGIWLFNEIFCFFRKFKIILKSLNRY